MGLGLYKALKNRVVCVYTDEGPIASALHFAHIIMELSLFRDTLHLEEKGEVRRGGL